MPQHLMVPMFQRRYVWTADSQWEPLWRDISRIAERRLQTVSPQHFLGAVVTQSRLTGMGLLASHGLIDGQQRLTTLQLLIGAAAAELDFAAQRIHCPRGVSEFLDAHDPARIEVANAESDA
jgi:uncharacterized protein with ParB-like and HNH nuclease domain